MAFSTTLPPPPPLITTFPTPSKPTPSYSLSQSLTSIAIAITLGFIVLFSTVLLASYICCRSAASRRHRLHLQPPPPTTTNHSDENSIYLPRIIFVSEEDENESQNGVVGLDQSVINSYPRFVYSKRNWVGGGNDTVCSICLCEYRESEVMRMLPDCRHCFHLMCVDAWLKLNASCPVCRSSPLPTPLSTPLQEVVPLSQYADGRRRQL